MGHFRVGITKMQVFTVMVVPTYTKAKRECKEYMLWIKLNQRDDVSEKCSRMDKIRNEDIQEKLNINPK